MIGLLIRLALVETGKKFRVEADEREAQMRECLPGNNCGACGCADCDVVAAAIVEDEVPANACPVASDDVLRKIGAITRRLSVPYAPAPRPSKIFQPHKRHFRPFRYLRRDFTAIQRSSSRTMRTFFRPWELPLYRSHRELS